MSIAMWCNDDAAFIDRDHLARQMAIHPLISGWVADAHTYLDMCDGRPLNEPDAAEKTPVVSDIPTLLLAGGFDPTTPPDYARFAAKTLSHSYLFAVPTSGHSVIDNHHCGSDLVAAFLADPESRPDIGCPDPDETLDFK